MSFASAVQAAPGPARYPSPAPPTTESGPTLPCRVTVVVMGVSGAGKTTVGSLLAQKLQCPFLDADDFHPPANKAKMQRGVPLTDQDRLPWLLSLCSAINAGLRLPEDSPHGALPGPLAEEREEQKKVVEANHPTHLGESQEPRPGPRPSTRSSSDRADADHWLSVCTLVLACSALKPAYRSMLREACLCGGHGADVAEPSKGAELFAGGGHPAGGPGGVAVQDGATEAAEAAVADEVLKRSSSGALAVRLEGTPNASNRVAPAVTPTVEVSKSNLEETSLCSGVPVNLEVNSGQGECIPAPARFILLSGTAEMFAKRVARRKGHFMPATMVESQMRTLDVHETEDDVLYVDASLSPTALVGQILQLMHLGPSRGHEF